MYRVVYLDQRSEKRVSPILMNARTLAQFLSSIETTHKIVDVLVDNLQPRTSELTVEQLIAPLAY